VPLCENTRQCTQLCGRSDLSLRSRRESVKAPRRARGRINSRIGISQALARGASTSVFRHVFPNVPGPVWYATAPSSSIVSAHETSCAAAAAAVDSRTATPLSTVDLGDPHRSWGRLPRAAMRSAPRHHGSRDPSSPAAVQCSRSPRAARSGGGSSLTRRGCWAGGQWGRAAEAGIGVCGA